MPAKTFFFLTEWIQNHQSVIWWTGSFSVFMVLGFFLAVPIIIVKLPAEYFMAHDTGDRSDNKKFSYLRLIYLIFKNIFGFILILAGIGMLFLPGQGVITLAIGLSLLSIPGKRQLMLKIIRRKKILSAMNKIRSRFNKPPLRI